MASLASTKKVPKDLVRMLIETGQNSANVVRNPADPNKSVENEIRTHFDQIAEMYYELVDRVWYEYGYCHQVEAAFLASLLRDRRPTRAIDAGSGPGRHTATLAAAAGSVVAVDISRKMLELAKRSLPPQARKTIEYVQADVRALPLKSGVADLVVNYEVLEHLPGGNKGLSNAFSEFRRVLAKKGTLVTEARLRRHRLIDMISPPSLKEISKEDMHRFYVRTPLTVGNAYDEIEIDMLLSRAGFKLHTKAFARVLPAGLLEHIPSLTKLDAMLEDAPIVRRFAREAIWLARAE